MDEKQFRQAMGKFATGVTVITTSDGKDIHGMTANAFMSVSLDPKLVVISVNNRAQMYEKIQQTKTYAVSILNETQSDISMHFAKQKQLDRSVEFEQLNGLPVIKDALAFITCDLEEAFKAGDHTLFLGRVTGIKINEKKKKPLTYFEGNYGTILSFD
ncbi:flavin reductase family protein [Fervidibacillus halotolerans]|uniref:Flavin reductase family protein n=1 Tax=Fervidibacillus halotolerans TaxID=2980027 RepID=A0A9E8M0Y0_9BACI|nr:flavin reductase family protein [Fervidibacillus halotolerans]WAA13420.1 flavin reductase family protein [Fervidibacillus halotolerans]